jgi:hypothetical protein
MGGMGTWERNEKLAEKSEQENSGIVGIWERGNEGFWRREIYWLIERQNKRFPHQQSQKLENPKRRQLKGKGTEEKKGKGCLSVGIHIVRKSGRAYKSHFRDKLSRKRF